MDFIIQEGAVLDYCPPCHPNPPIATSTSGHLPATLISSSTSGSQPCCPVQPESSRGTRDGVPRPCLLLSPCRLQHLVCPDSAPARPYNWEEGTGRGKELTGSCGAWQGLDLGVWEWRRKPRNRQGGGTAPLLAFGLVGW